MFRIYSPLIPVIDPNTGVSPQQGYTTGGTTVRTSVKSFAVAGVPPASAIDVIAYLVSNNGVKTSVLVSELKAIPAKNGALPDISITLICPSAAIGEATITIQSRKSDVVRVSFPFTFVQPPMGSPLVMSVYPSNGAFTGGSTVTVTLMCCKHNH